MVQPSLSIFTSEGLPVAQASIRTESSRYRTGARNMSFSYSGPITQFPEAVAAPFTLEIRRHDPRQDYLLLDVFPTFAETLVVKWPPPNLRIAASWPTTIADDRVTNLRAVVNSRLSFPSEHIELTTVRTSSWTGYFETREEQTLLAVLPATADSINWVEVTWVAEETPTNPRLSFQGRLRGVSYPGVDEIAVAASFEPMVLRATWEDGLSDLVEFDFAASSTRPDGSTEAVDMYRVPGSPPSTVVGWVGEMDLTVTPRLLTAVFPWKGTVVWNGVDEVSVELGRHALSIQVVDAESQPVRFAQVRLSSLVPGSPSGLQSTGLDGRVVWFVNDGDYIAELEDDAFNTGQRGGPWRVTAPTSVTWEAR